MTGFTLQCLGKGFDKGPWRFEPRADRVDVINPAGQTVYFFRHSKAEDCLLLPSFWQSVKHVGFAVDDKTTVWFEPTPEAVGAVRVYLEECALSGGMPAIDRLGRKGWINLLCGAGLFLVCFVLIGLAREVLQENHHARFALGAVFLGSIAQAAWGISLVLRAAKLRRKLWQR
jgi:hypothetical protein